MKAKTELLLYRLWWLAEKPLRPTYHHLEQSFEGWAYQNGLLNQIQQLEAQGFLEARQDPASGKRLHRLTEAGRAAAMGGRDPEVAWAQPWDQKWRLFLFDIPQQENAKRRQLTRALAKAGCGCLQHSVWISPFTPPAIESLIAEDDPDCSHLMMLHADSKGQKADAKIVAGSWDFEAINQSYQKLQTVLEDFSKVERSRSRESLMEWTAAENTAARACLRTDPLLPAELLPKNYLGQKTWDHRRKILSEAARLAAALRSESEK